MGRPNSTEQVLLEIQHASEGAERIVFVSGNFNVLHPGHLRLLQFAAECGDFLVVGVNNRTYPGASLSEEVRLAGVKALGFVNHAFILPETAERLISLLQPDIVVKGTEHEGKQNPEQSVVDAYGGKLLFCSGDMRFSSFDQLERQFLEAGLSPIIRPHDFLGRRGIKPADIRSVLQRFQGLRVTVIGDLIVDEYIACDPLGMSQEDPTIVVTPVQRDLFIGGAAIVAAHAHGLGADVEFFSVAGLDGTAEFASQKLKAGRIGGRLFPDESRPTTLKQRYRASGKTLLRVSHLRQHDVSRHLMKAMFDAIMASIEHSDLLIFSDFNYGCLPQALVDDVSAACLKHDVPMAADSQSSSQVGDISRFKDTMLTAATEREARLAMRDFHSGLVVTAEKLRQATRAKNVAVKLGSEGVLIHTGDSEANGGPTDRVAALNTAPRDVAGAGDSFLACSAMALAAGASAWEAGYMGSLAAACQISRIGNIPLSINDIESELDDERWEIDRNAGHASGRGRGNAA